MTIPLSSIYPLLPVNQVVSTAVHDVADAVRGEKVMREPFFDRAYLIQPG
jgi:hypothetical protein